MGKPELKPVPGEVPESEVEDAPTTVCCCGHPAEYHLGGPDLDAQGLYAYRLTHLGGDGGMCRAPVGEFKHGRSTNHRCDCFNFCDCHVIAARIRREIAEDEGA